MADRTDHTVSVSAAQRRANRRNAPAPLQAARAAAAAIDRAEGEPVPQNAPRSGRTQNAQNEPNCADPIAGDATAEGCEQGWCNVELITPTKLAPRDPAVSRGSERSDAD